MNQSEFLLIACNFLYAREKSRLQGAIGFGFGFGSHWLKKWREIFKRITKPSNCNRVTTFDCHSKFALHVCCGWPRNRNKLAFSSLLTTLSQSAMSIANILSLNCWIFDCRSDSPIQPSYQPISDDDNPQESASLIPSPPMPTTVRNLKFLSSFRRSLARFSLVSKPCPGMSIWFYPRAIYSAYLLYEHAEMRCFQQRHVTKKTTNSWNERDFENPNANRFICGNLYFCCFPPYVP